MKHNLLNFPLYILLISVVFSCEWEGYEEHHSEDDLDELLELNENRFGDWEKRKQTQARYVMAEFPANTFINGYQTGYDIVELKMDEDVEMEFSVFKSYSDILLQLSIDLPDSIEFPQVRDLGGRGKDDADYLQMTVTIRSPQLRGKIRVTDSESVSSYGKVELYKRIKPSDYYKVKNGMTTFSVEVQTEFVSFFDYKSGVRPLSVKLEFDFQVPEIHKSVIHFKSLVLDKDPVRRLLGSNDFSNPDPETGIRISCNGKTYLYEHSKNSFQYTSRHNETYYHVYRNDTLEIDILDVDYGFNGNDYINDTLIRVKDLEQDDYMNIRMKYVNELMLYSEYKGVVN